MALDTELITNIVVLVAISAVVGVSLGALITARQVRRRREERARRELARWSFRYHGA